jgi:methionine-S-sulfoxide reductase
MEGVVRTRSGYGGGTTEDPVYEDLGDHTETVLVEYDPSRVSYGELLEAFWTSHNPTSPSWSVQYRSVIFTADDEQRRAAEKSAARLRSDLGVNIHTAIEPMGRFYSAEDYHQKHYVRRDYVLMREYGEIYATAEEFAASPSTAKANGILAGLASREEAEKILPMLGLSEEARKRLLARTWQEDPGRKGAD